MVILNSKDWHKNGIWNFGMSKIHLRVDLTPTSWCISLSKNQAFVCVIKLSKTATGIYVLLKALPPVCIEYTSWGESQVANIAWGEAECYICHETLTKNYIFHTNKVAVL